MYILGLSSSWGTSWICPAWSSSEHQLTPALSPFWGPRSKPRRSEEVVYTPNDSCSNFTQRLFPPKLPRNIHELFLMIHSTSFIPIVHHIHTTIISFIYITYSLFHFFGSLWQAGCPWSLVSDTISTKTFVMSFRSVWHFKFSSFPWMFSVPERDRDTTIGWLKLYFETVTGKSTASYIQLKLKTKFLPAWTIIILIQIFFIPVIVFQCPKGIETRL